MTIKELKEGILGINELNFALPNGRLIPSYFHITEMGLKTKKFIDCGNTLRSESLITFQIWHAQDYQHRLDAQKFRQIISAAEPLFDSENLEIEVEYQSDLSLSIFSLSLEEGVFKLIAKESTCLASDHCGIPPEKMKLNLNDLISSSTSCAPGGGCC